MCTLISCATLSSLGLIELLHIRTIHLQKRDRVCLSVSELLDICSVYYFLLCISMPTQTSILRQICFHQESLGWKTDKTKELEKEVKIDYD